MTIDNPISRAVIYALPDLEGCPPTTFPAATPEHIPQYAALLPPTFQEWDEAEQLANASSKIREHYIRNEGIIPFVGPIALYLLTLGPERTPIAFTTRGERVELPSAHPALQVTFVIKERSWLKKAFANSLCSTNDNTFN